MQALAQRMDAYDLSDLAQLHADGHMGSSYGGEGGGKEQEAPRRALRYFAEATRIAPNLAQLWNNYGRIS